MIEVAAGIIALVQAAGPAQFAVVSGQDTAWVASSDAIRVEAGTTVNLATVMYDADRRRVDTKEVWWHGGDDQWLSLEKDGTLVGRTPGEVEVMFHWTTPHGGGALHWVTIEVVAKED